MKPVAKIDLPYVQAMKDRHGKPRHYYRRKGYSRVTLPGTPGSAEFMAAYAEADARARRPHELAAQARIQPRSINALIVEYYRSDEFLALRSITQRGYRNVLDRFRARHGDKGAASIEPRHLEGIFHDMAGKPGAVRNLRARLRTIFSLAVRLGWRRDNPVRETKAPRRRGPGFLPWSEEHIAQYMAHWGPGTKQRLAFLLYLHLGQRRTDASTMGRQHIEGGALRVVQSKTGEVLLIPMHPELVAEIARHPAGLTFLTTQYGAPYTPAGLGNWFKDACVAAGIMDRSAHGLRKALGRRIAEAEGTEKQIAAVLGHRTLEQVAVYTRDAAQRKLAEQAAKRLRKAEKRTAGVNRV